MRLHPNPTHSRPGAVTPLNFTNVRLKPTLVTNRRTGSHLKAPKA